VGLYQGGCAANTIPAMYLRCWDFFANILQKKVGKVIFLQKIFNFVQYLRNVVR
jgi:hypothetical protein